MTRRPIAASLFLALPLLAGCRSDEGPLNPPDLSNNRGLLARYVSMGNSITAGFQSAGINDSTQLRSYARVVAEQAGAPFFVPLLNKPGCPAPFVVNVTQTRLGGAGDADCALRNPAPLPYVSNVAVPGALVGSVTDNAVAANALTTFILGGRTQAQAMAAAKPTFVSVWIGNNDVLGSLTSSTNPGDPALVTPIGTFQTQYQAVVDTIAGTGAKAILIGVVDVSLMPYSTAGQVYYCLKTGACPGIPAGGFPPTFDVSPTCAPPPAAKGDSILVPWTVGITMLSAAAEGAHTTLDCSVDAEVVTPAEFKGLRDAVAGYNAFIQQQATAHGWAYLDLNPTLVASKANPALITTFPNLPSAATGGNVTFGSFFSLDGVHPSSAAHRVIADSIISAVNATYQTTIPFAGP
jgi:hypothetical protein